MIGSRSMLVVPLISSGERASSSPATTQSGTTAGGSVNSIGTKTIAVGTVCPPMTSKYTRATTAYATTSVAATHRRGIAPAEKASASAATIVVPPADQAAIVSRWG